MLKKSSGNPKPSKVKVPSNKAVDQFKLSLLNELHAQIMVVVFMGSAFTVVSYFTVTLISVFDATRLFALFGGGGFLAAFFLKDRLNLTLMDGLCYNFFGVAPLALALLLAINAQCNDYYTKTYKVVGTESGGSGFTCILKDDALEDCWHIRNLSGHSTGRFNGHLQLTLCKGVFGIEVMQGRTLNP